MKTGQVAFFGGWYKVKLQYHRLQPANTVPVILQLRLYALFDCSKKLLVFMMTVFATEVGVVMWILVAIDLLDYGSFFDIITFSLSPTIFDIYYRNIF